MQNLKFALPAIVGGVALIGSLAFVGTAMAAGPGSGVNPGGPMTRPAVVGKVESISGDTLTIASQTWQRGSATSTPAVSTTYTVDATNATVTKDRAASSVSAIADNDFVMVQGTVSGTTVTATSINDMGANANMQGGAFGGRMHGGTGTSTPPMHTGTTTPPFVGNGEPVIGGSVTAISGTTLTVTTTAGTAYTVDGSSATVLDKGKASALTDIAIGDNVVVQGTVDGTSVTASTILDSGASASGGTGKSGGILGGIGSFITRLFGFF